MASTGSGSSPWAPSPSGGAPVSRLALRDFDGAHVVLPGKGGEAAEPETPRDFEAFTEWVGDRAAGWERPADYWRPGHAVPARTASLTAAYTLLGHARWFVFDGGGSAAWSFPASGYNGSGGGAGEFGNALSAWNDDPGSTIAYGGGGPSSPNSITFNDPGGDVDGVFGCGSGGVLGIGGYSSSGTGQHNGETFDRIVNGFIVINDDNDGNPATSCACFFQSAGAADEVFAHELGHTLGLSHSTVPGALMRATAYNDGRGAQLGADDQAGIAFLYGSGGPPPPPPQPPAAPSNLGATAVSSSQIQISWQDNSNNETSFRIEMRAGGGSFSEIGSTSANVPGATVSGLQAATTYTFRVRARNANGNSSYSNEASATTHSAPPPPPPPGGPAAPSNLQAAAQSTSRVRLTWTDNATNETAFHVEMTLDGFTFGEVGTVGANVTTTDIDGLQPATGYSFRVRARNGNGFSSFSNTANATTQGTPPPPPPPPTLPAAPSGLVASALANGQIRLDWQDNSANEGSFHIERRSGGGGFAEVGATGPNTSSFDAGGLAPGTSYTFRVRAQNGAGYSGYSNEASATTNTPSCSSDPNAICLQGNRFAVSLEWVSPQGQRSSAHPVRLTDDSATFWFLNPANTEVLVKVHNACSLPGQPAYWVFAAGLTNVNTELRVRDTWASGRSRFYENAPGVPFVPIQDTDAFETCGEAPLRESSVAPAAAAPAPPVLWAPADLAAPATTCTTDSTRLCLRGGRFKIEAFWRADDGRSGTGTPVKLGDQSGYFWFFNPANVEVLAKVHNGCGAQPRPLLGLRGRADQPRGEAARHRPAAQPGARVREPARHPVQADPGHERVLDLPVKGGHGGPPPTIRSGGRPWPPAPTIRSGGRPGRRPQRFVAAAVSGRRTTLC